MISVDWRKLANTSPFYNIAAANTKPVGYLTADLVNFLVSLDLDSIYNKQKATENFPYICFYLTKAESLHE